MLTWPSRKVWTAVVRDFLPNPRLSNGRRRAAINSRPPSATQQDDRFDRRKCNLTVIIALPILTLIIRSTLFLSLFQIFFELWIFFMFVPLAIGYDASYRHCRPKTNSFYLNWKMGGLFPSSWLTYCTVAEKYCRFNHFPTFLTKTNWFPLSARPNGPDRFTPPPPLRRPDLFSLIYIEKSSLFFPFFFWCFSK